MNVTMQRGMICDLLSWLSHTDILEDEYEYEYEVYIVYEYNMFV